MDIAVIPARGGSKRIANKNIKEFCGKPMIAYAIEAVRASDLFERIIVSTDDENIAKIARSFGAETPFMRPSTLADDLTPTVPVVAHAVKACKALGWNFDRVCCIYPSVPFLQLSDLRGARARLNSNESEYCFPVTEYPSSIWRSLRLSNNGKTQAVYPEFSLTRTQDLNATYYDAGQFYWGNVDTWLTKENIHSNGIGFPIPNWRVVDIDTQDDWLRAELLYRAINNSVSEL